MSTEISPKRRAELAALLGISDAYLYQCISPGIAKRREMEPGAAMEAETRTNGELKRWMLRHYSWHRIWPELIGSDGAPEPIKDDEPEEVAADLRRNADAPTAFQERRTPEDDDQWIAPKRRASDKPTADGGREG